MGPWFSLGHCDPTSGHISNPRVSYERYGYHLSIDTFCFIVGWVVWSQRIVKVEYFLTFFRKSEFFTLRWKQIFENFFSNCSHLKTIWWKFVKPTGNSHKYPKFSYAKRSSKKYWAVSEFLKFKVLAPCGRHANEMICPFPLACPCYLLEIQNGGIAPNIIGRKIGWTPLHWHEFNGILRKGVYLDTTNYSQCW